MNWPLGAICGSCCLGDTAADIIAVLIGGTGGCGGVSCCRTVRIVALKVYRSSCAMWKRFLHCRN